MKTYRSKNFIALLLACALAFVASAIAVPAPGHGAYSPEQMQRALAEMGKRSIELKKAGKQEAAEQIDLRIKKLKEMQKLHAQRVAKETKSEVKSEAKKADHPAAAGAKKSCPGCAAAKASGKPCPKCAAGKAKATAAAGTEKSCPVAKTSDKPSPKCAAGKAKAAAAGAKKGCHKSSIAKASGKSCPKCPAAKAKAERDDDDHKGHRDHKGHGHHQAGGDHHRGGDHRQRWQELLERFESAHKRMLAERGKRTDCGQHPGHRAFGKRGSAGGGCPLARAGGSDRGCPPARAAGSAGGESREEHLRKAMMHLRAAGLDEVIERLGAHLLRAFAGRAASHRHHGASPHHGRSQAPSATDQRLGRAVGEMRKDIDQLKRELQQLKAGIARAHKAHGVQPKSRTAHGGRHDGEKMREMMKRHHAEHAKRAAEMKQRGDAKKPEAKKDAPEKTPAAKKDGARKRHDHPKGKKQAVLILA